MKNWKTELFHGRRFARRHITDGMKIKPNAKIIEKNGAPILQYANANRQSTQAERVFARFGGARRLQLSLASVGVHRNLATIYKWSYPPSQGGTGGHIPAKAMREVILAARHDGILLPNDLMNPSDVTPRKDDDAFPIQDLRRVNGRARTQKARAIYAARRAARKGKLSSRNGRLSSKNDA